MVRFYIKERDKTVFLSPSSSSSFCRRRRLSLSVWQNAKRRASLRTGCDEPMRCIDTSPGRCARALRVVQRSSRVFFAFECSKKKETRRGQTLGEVIAKKGQKSYLFLVFCPKRDLKNRLKEEKKVSKKKERKKEKKTFLPQKRKNDFDCC